MNGLIQLFSNNLPSKKSTGSSFEFFVSPVESVTAGGLVLPQDPCARDFNEDYFYFCQRNLPIGQAVNHMVVIGTTGAGKTTVLNAFNSSIAKRFKPGRKKAEQLVIFDAKGDTVPFLASLGYRP